MKKKTSINTPAFRQDNQGRWKKINWERPTNQGENFYEKGHIQNISVLKTVQVDPCCYKLLFVERSYT